jgi:hypothetical protein
MAMTHALWPLKKGFQPLESTAYEFPTLSSVQLPSQVTAPGTTSN